ncbi:VOC family protein [Pseudomonadota bacterium]
MSRQFKSVNPILPVISAAKTAAYYKEKLGFDIVVICEEPSYAVVRRGDVTIEFGEGRPDYAGKGTCYIHVECADTVFEEYRSAKLEYIGAIKDRDYGNRDFRVRDNNGNTLIIGMPLASAVS